MGSGKTTFFREHFEPKGYAWVNRDTLGSMHACVAATERALSTGQSVVIDNTNPSVLAREQFVSIAQKHGVSARCCYFDVPERVGWHNNLYRAFAPVARKPNEVRSRTCSQAQY